MAELIFLNILIIGAGLLILVFVRALPRVESSEETAMPKRNFFERWLTSELPQKIDKFFSTAYVRALRRVKVWVLRLENTINQKLQRIKLESGGGIGTPKIDLKKVVESKAGEGMESIDGVEMLLVDEDGLGDEN